MGHFYVSKVYRVSAGTLSTGFVLGLMCLCVSPAAAQDYEAGERWSSDVEWVYQQENGSWISVDDDGMETPLGNVTSGSSEWFDVTDLDFGTRSGTVFELTGDSALQLRSSIAVEAWKIENDYAAVVGPNASATGLFRLELDPQGEGLLNTGLKAEGKLIAEANVAKVQAGVDGQAGSDDLNVGIGANASGQVGANAMVGGYGSVSRNNASLGVGANAFAGATAKGSIPLTMEICDLVAKGIVMGKATAGAGAEANADINLNFKDLKFKVSGAAAATLGLGAGGGGVFVVDLSPIANDRQALQKCLAMVGSDVVVVVSEGYVAHSDAEAKLAESQRKLIGDFFNMFTGFLGGTNNKPDGACRNAGGG